jgi:hypothetical protein
MTTLSEYLKARAELAEGIRIFTEDMTPDERSILGVPISIGAARTLLAGPPVSREEVARVIEDWHSEASTHGVGLRVPQQYRTSLVNDLLAALYRGETK